MSVGIIGGADGPTAIFLSSSVNWLLIASAAAAAAAAVAAAVVVIIKKRKGK